ncbi:MAG: hypothetical protein WCR07_14635, partial [Verrucomicrobiota bacterium]
MNTRWNAALLALGWLMGGSLLAQMPPFEIADSRGTPNYQSVRGVPISRVKGTPPGSDGRVPNSNESTGIYVTPTAGQFKSLSVVGGTSGLRKSAWSKLTDSAGLNAGTSPLTGAVAVEMGLPVGKSASGTVVLFNRRVQVAMPVFVRRSTLNFGSIIEVPVLAENGVKLPDGTSTDYWVAEPYTVTNHEGGGYYWSPHAGRAYAIQPGPISVTWIKAQPYTLSTVPNYVNTGGTQSFMTNGANVFLLYTQRYIVSGTPVKPTRNMYWTQKGYQSSGKPILIPTARVGAVNIVYNATFPRTVTREYKGIGDTSPTDGSTNSPLQELRTLWYEQQVGSLYAYNTEGRVFVEMLGDAMGEGRRASLGFEIVDVIQQPIPLDVRVELGERIVPPLGENPDALEPEPLRQVIGQPFAYREVNTATGRSALYATRETQNLNDYLIHWMEQGVAGIAWPKTFGRYELYWPTDIAKYNLYVRPQVETEVEAQATAVRLNSMMAPSVEFQDALDRPRAALTADFKFYSYLDATQPAHRSLIRFVSGERVSFERVFSWYLGSLRSTNYAGNTIVTNLTAWNGQTLVWPEPLKAPQIVNETVSVGQRILPPAGEPGQVLGDPYWAGYIQQSEGTSFDVTAYIDPFAAGFEAADKGSIIPVNAIPGKNRLEVWWFRPTTTRAGHNSGNTKLGFSLARWPSAVGRYTLAWPTSPREIVMASKLGGVDATVAEAKGAIYYQNDPTLPGYNPNEEHAIMSGGTPYATRDDLNIVTPGDSYSSHPFVLVSYQAFDGRPAMGVFKVLREKPEAGWVFDYLVPAGQMMQPPPPLTFLQKPTVGLGDAATSRNYEPKLSEQDLPIGWRSSDTTNFFAHYPKFTYTDRQQDVWVYRGPHTGLPAVVAGTYDPDTRMIQPVGTVRVMANQVFRVPIHVSRQDEFMALNVQSGPNWVAANGLGVGGTPPDSTTGNFVVTYAVRDLYDQSAVTNHLTIQVVASGTPSVPSPLAIVSTNRYTGTIVTFTNRPPFLAQSPNGSNSFTMRYYYKTEASFAWPGIANPPVAGSIVPYLRPLNPTTGEPIGDPTSDQTVSLDIVYRPFWPERDPKDSSKPVPTLPFAATLAKPAFGLPGVRDFRTAHVLYQQSIASNVREPVVSAVLHDATRAKFSDIFSLTNGTWSAIHGVGPTQLRGKEYVGKFPQAGYAPPSVKMTMYQGKYYFPNLPPHLATRVFIDPNRGTRGQLVFQGEFKDEVLGESYLMPNVLRGSDLAAVVDLCPGSDPLGRAAWQAFVMRLSTDVETFMENPEMPGTYIPDATKTKEMAVDELAEVDGDNVMVDSYALSATGPGSGYVTLLEASGTARTKPGDPVSMHVLRVGGGLSRGEVKPLLSSNPLSELVTFQFTGDMAARYDEFEYEWKIAAPVDGFPPQVDASMSRYLSLKDIGTDIPRVTIGGAGIQALGDNYVVMRYRPISPSHPLYKENPTDADWSAWTSPALAEGWIKRVLAGINPFNQRVTDLFNNRVNTDVSLLTQAGKRWEGDVALNIDTINNYGLIEIYETVLRRGRSLSIESGYNYGPANDALLLAAGYLSDLYMMIGNEAWADAANPTIGIGTADQKYGDIATSLFSFKGQVPSLLEEELGLLRGRDDFLLPGVEVAPVYNRLVWNYTRGIDAGEVIYALNYNISEKEDTATDGVLNATDAAYMYPQGHGDAYGHYLTAIKGYYSLLLNSNFDWVPRIEAVNILGKPVSVDYQDERKFAAAAAAMARAGRQVFDLSWRKDYQSVRTRGWSHLSPVRENTQRSFVDTATGATNHPVRTWGADHWASRVAQGTYLNWVVGNAILPAIDPDPTHEGIQKVDRTNVPELRELAMLAAGLNTSVDSCEGGLSPLGISEGGLALDINPNQIGGTTGGTHFDQVYQRAIQALKNAQSAFDDAKDVTRLMRSEEDSLSRFQASVLNQERAYTNMLVEIYGTPYPDDVGPGKTYVQGYEGPDFIHYGYVDKADFDFPDLWNLSSKTAWKIPIMDFDYEKILQNPNRITYNQVPVSELNPEDADGVARNGITIEGNKFYFDFDLGPHGFLIKPADWKGVRRAPGRIQDAINKQMDAHGGLAVEINRMDNDRMALMKLITFFKADADEWILSRVGEGVLLGSETVVRQAEFANNIFQLVQDSIKEDIVETADGAAEALPTSFVAGLASGGDVTSAGRAALLAAGLVTKSVTDKVKILRNTLVMTMRNVQDTARALYDFNVVGPFELMQRERGDVRNFIVAMEEAQLRLDDINALMLAYDQSKRGLRAVLAEGDRIQAERMVFRRQTASVIQGYRTRDAAFRVFRNEKLERYKTLLDLASRYALMAANAYDYETGLLGTSQGRDFVGRITASRALGVMRDGEPQFAGSNTGDPGLSSALAEMKADWEVLRGRLGFNNPDAYGTTVSLRTENYRILPGADGESNWRDVLSQAYRADVLQDTDVRRLCMQIDNGSGLPVPGLIFTFSTTVTDGENVFGQPLAAGDSNFSPSAFATKIHSVGVSLEGYRGMAWPSANAGTTTGTGGGTSPTDPGSWFLDPMALAATPWVYLIPVGVDSMRSPPLGDRSEVRSWTVEDLAIPMPFNIGGSQYATKQLYQSADSLSEPMFSIRKHQAFRPVPSSTVFSPQIYTANGNLQRSQFTNSRLIGRSVWNSQWKLVIPGNKLLANPKEGLDRFRQTVKDIKL